MLYLLKTHSCWVLCSPSPEPCCLQQLMLVVWDQNRNGKRKEKKAWVGVEGEGAAEVRHSIGESAEEVGSEVGGVQWLKHETAEMSRTRNSCEPNYIKNGSWPTSGCHLLAFTATALFTHSSSKTKSSGVTSAPSHILYGLSCHFTLRDFTIYTLCTNSHRRWVIFSRSTNLITLPQIILH